MTARFSQSALLVFVIAGGISLSPMSGGQEASRQQPSEQSAGAVPPVPQGVEVLARGPVHEAFATPTTDPAPTKPAPKAPPTALDELPPNEKPEGAVWIGGYWAWDDERSDFPWVSGIWRTPPPGQRWDGYLKATGHPTHTSNPPNDKPDSPEWQAWNQAREDAMKEVLFRWPSFESTEYDELYAWLQAKAVPTHPK